MVLAVWFCWWSKLCGSTGGVDFVWFYWWCSSTGGLSCVVLLVVLVMWFYWLC